MICEDCGDDIETPGKTGLCYGCWVWETYIPPDYEDQERYAPACTECGRALRVISRDARGRPILYECEFCLARCGAGDWHHQNATECPPIGCDWLDRSVGRRSVIEAMAAHGVRLRW